MVVIGDLLYDMLALVGEGGAAPGVDTFTRIHASPGGSAANVAAHLARLGTGTLFVGKVGDDAFGDFLVAEMEGLGVDARVSRERGLPSGKVFVMVDGEGERTMITDRGASEKLGVEDLPEDAFREGDHLHLTGYMFSGGSRREAALGALKQAREAGMTVSVDPSSTPLLESVGTERFLLWTSGADLCFPNLGEGSLLSGARDADSIARGLLSSYRAVALKLGAGGALYAAGSGETLSLPASEVEVADTTGAGDAFCAGFLSAWVAGGSARDSLARGVFVAGKVVESFGGGRGTR